MRNLKPVELEFITFMLNNTKNYKHLIEGLENSKVTEMNDGGMGSLRFEDKNSEDVRFGKEIAKYDYLDVDDMGVSITLNLDNKNELFELDIFKGDFSPLIQFPKPPFSVLNFSF